MVDVDPGVDGKACSYCGEVKPLAMFYKRSDGHGYRSRCRPCQTASRAEYSRSRYLIHREEQSKLAREWYANNTDRARVNNQKWRESNREKRNGYQAARRRLTGGAARIPDELIKEKLAFNGNKCWMCGGPGDTSDHVKPLSKGGPHLLANIRPACGPCNQRKSSRWYGVSGIGRFRIPIAR